MGWKLGAAFAMKSISATNVKHRNNASTDISVRLPWFFALIGALFGLCIALVVWAPASILAWGVAKTSKGQMQWLNTRGTVWQGSAHLSISGGPGSSQSQVLPGRVHWTLSSAWSGIRLGWKADCCMAEPSNVKANIGWGTFSLLASDHSSIWPAAMLSGLGAPWNTLQAKGQMQLSTEDFRVQWSQGRLQMYGKVELNLLEMSSRLSPVKPMGSYRIVLAGTPEGTPTPDLELSTLQGPLLLSGQGQWVGQRLRFKGEARAIEGHETAFDNLLNILGRRDGLRSLLSLG